MAIITFFISEHFVSFHFEPRSAVSSVADIKSHMLVLFTVSHPARKSTQLSVPSLPSLPFLPSSAAPAQHSSKLKGETLGLISCTEQSATTLWADKRINSPHALATQFHEDRIFQPWSPLLPPLLFQASISIADMANVGPKLRAVGWETLAATGAGG